MAPELEATTKRSCAGESWVDTTLAEWPVNDFRIFVGNMGPDASDDALAKSFSKYTSFQKARVVRDHQTRKALGYGFVSFKDPWDMTSALREMEGKYVANRPITVRKSTWKERSLSGGVARPTSNFGDHKKRNRSGDSSKRPHVHKKKKGMPW